MKKVLSVFMVALMIFLISITAFAANVTLSKDDYGDFSDQIDGISGTLVG